MQLGQTKTADIEKAHGWLEGLDLPHDCRAVTILKNDVGDQQVDALSQRVAMPHGAWLIFALDYLSLGRLKD